MKNNKKAFIDQLLMGFIIISMITLFVGTISDEFSARNKHKNLKEVVQTASLSAAKYYIYQNEDTQEAEDIALGIVEQTPLGLEVKDDIVFTWDFDVDPNFVKATIPTYSHDNFWFRLLQWDSVSFDNIESKANIISVILDELPILDETSNFLPFAINECGQEGIKPGDSFSFIYKSYGIFDTNDSTGFYGLDPSNPDRDDGSQSGFAHFKNEVLDFNRLNTKQYLVDSDQASIENDAQQLASTLEVHKFDEPMNISIALIDCNSTKDDIYISNIVDVNLSNIYCGHKQTPDDTIEDVFENETGFETIVWVNWVESKDCSQSGLFRIDIDVTIPEIDSVLLEY